MLVLALGMGTQKKAQAQRDEGTGREPCTSPGRKWGPLSPQHLCLAEVELLPGATQSSTWHPMTPDGGLSEGKDSAPGVCDISMRTWQ